MFWLNGFVDACFNFQLNKTQLIYYNFEYIQTLNLWPDATICEKFKI